MKPAARHLAVVALAAMTLAACGRGGGGETAAPDPRSAPPPAVRSGETTAAPPALGRAGEVTVTAAEFAAYVRKEKGRDVATLAPDSRRQGLRRLLVRKALAREAEKAGFDREENALRAFFQWRLSNYPSRFWERTFEKVEVTDDELRAHLAPQPRYLLSAMVFAADAEGEEAAWETHGLLRQGRDFSSLAKERSQGLLREQGGDMGWMEIPNRSVPGEAVGPIARIGESGFTEPILTQVGWVIFQVRDVRSAEEVFAQKREDALAEVLAAKQARLKAEAIKGLRSRATIVYPDPTPGGPAVVIDGRPISRVEAGGGDPQHQFTAKAVDPEKSQLESFIDVYLVTREVERLGWDKDPELAIPFALHRIELLSQAWVVRQARGKAEVSDAEIGAEYRRYYRPEIYTLQAVHTLDRAAAEAALREIEGGRDFGAVSAQRSAGRIKAANGMIGTMPLSDLPDEVRKAVEAVPDGGHTGVLDNGGNGFIILKRITSQRIEVPALEKVAGDIRRRLALRKKSDAVQEYVDGFTRGLKFEIDDAALGKL